MSAHRYTVLDGMRGIAAFAVFDRHLGGGFGLSHHMQHGYLAVDFFFALSGFVLAEAYDERLAKGMGFGAFFHRRCVRLYPMVLAGAVLGLLSFNPGWSGGRFELFMLDFASASLLPLGLLFGQTTFPTNIPVWSLFFELFANVVFFGLIRVRTLDAPKTVMLLLAAAAILGAVAHLAGQIGAVGVNSVPSFLAGFVRVTLSFGAGVAISRFRCHVCCPVWPGWLVVLALAVLLAVPDCGWWYDMFCVACGFPLLLCLGARAVSPMPTNRVWLWAGRVSYPLYVIQEPLLRAVFRLIGPGTGPALLAAGLTFMAAFLLLRFYDEPLRAWLAPARALSEPAL
ncbi:acyltransferase family protein [Acidocella sp.]|uniref:acyltransferase family protein n=1 Tax=Acidocella sp. TaxID=50710 RepID=UPI003D06EEC8